MWRSKILPPWRIKEFLVSAFGYVPQITDCHLLQLSFDLLESWLRRNPNTVALKKDGVSAFRELALFQDYHGLPAFKDVRYAFSSG